MKAKAARLMGMTGFARAEGASLGVSWAWEARSVNGRGLDLRLRLPAGFDGLEPALRERAQKRFARGSVQLALQLRREAAANPPRVNLAQIEALLEACRPLLASGRARPPSLDGLLALRGALEAAEPDEGALSEETREALLATADAALAGLQEAREAEGRALDGVLRGLLDQIAALCAQADRRALAQPGLVRDKLAQRLAELARDAVSEERLAQEVAVLAAKADMREELDRLAAHVAGARELLDAGGPVGRKLDFLTQEFMREANTVCAKSADITLTRTGLELKAVVDQLREQVQNVE